MVAVKEMRDLLPSDLSTGMKRSVAIARALAAQPECVLYDEPTTMVDPLMAQLLGDLISRLKSSTASHQRCCDARYAPRAQTRRPNYFPSRRPRRLLRTYADMEKSPEPIVREFIELDELKIEV